MKPYYSRAGIQIFHGDCREILPQLPACDVVITDPPYGARNDIGSRSREPISCDCEGWFEQIFPRVPRVVVTPGIGNVGLYPPAKWMAAWFKPASSSFNIWGGWNVWEPILIYGDPPARLIKDAYEDCTSSPNGHPCPKPMRLWTWVVSWASVEGETILDPLMGSGTTLEAAKKMGRQCIGIEIEEKYCEIAAKRLSQEVFQW